MESSVIRQTFLDFFKNRGHVVIPSAPLVPEHDPSVLFTTAGMQSLIPFILGENHPSGQRLVNVQKCIRTQDIDEVGDATHDTFFEMLGNWSLGSPSSPNGIGNNGYFKEEAIKWSYELLTSNNYGFGLDPNRLYITCFAGDDDAPKDNESAKNWQNMGIPKEQIYFLGKDDNWWSPGDSGPCGPDTEMFYDITQGGLGRMTHEEFVNANSNQKVIEIWNDVFIEYEKKDGKVIGKLKQKNVDTGAGLERLAMVLQNKENIFETDLFSEIMGVVRTLTPDLRKQRVIADHVRTAVFIISENIIPSNTDRGYVLRRLIRRAVFYSNDHTISRNKISDLVDTVINKYGKVYPALCDQNIKTKRVIEQEQTKFQKTIAQGLRVFDKLLDHKVTGKEAFILFSTYGFPYELTEELAKKRGMSVDREDFLKEVAVHQDISRTGAQKKFKGGLVDNTQISLKYHTATHLLHQALRDVLGQHVYQKGSNITSERLRFDFSHEKKLTSEEIKNIEEIVNKKIADSLLVTHQDISEKEARDSNAIGLFEEKYGNMVRLYKIGDYSLEYCGGPHVSNTSELGIFKIIKEEAISTGVRRIKAILI